MNLSVLLLNRIEIFTDLKEYLNFKDGNEKYTQKTDVTT